jgi:hypothetical protein
VTGRPSSDRPANDGPDPAQRRRIRRGALLLGLVAVAIYVAFILSGVFKAQG